MAERRNYGSGANKSKGRVAVAYRRVSELRLRKDNARQHSAKQIRQIARSIESFGFNVPILVDANLAIIAGHGRILACRLLGWDEVPTICLEHLSEAQARAFVIADNRLSELSEWNDELLAEQLRDLSVLDLNFELEAVGFSTSEIDLRIEALGAGENGPDDSADEPAVASAGPAVSCVGDLFLLGPHRVYCGSALDDAAYLALMDQKVAAMVFSDPPFNVPIEGHVSGRGAVHHREFSMAAGEMNEEEFVAFLTKAFSLLAGNSADGTLNYLFMDWRHLTEILAAGRAVYSELKNLVIWVKDNGGLGSLYRSQHELIFVFKHGRASHRNNIQLGQYGRNRSNVWHYAGANSFAGRVEDGNPLTIHPTCKPVALVADAILDCTARGEIVLDAFLGSGTTLIAAERTKRVCFGLEIDPLYVDTIVRRWQTLTGENARNATNGRTFNEREIEMAANKTV
jgi:DNA modification methylase